MNRILFVILLIFISSKSLAQHSVRGQVFESETHAPLPGANVFIANTTYGVATDTAGRFEITGLIDAHYDVVVSFLGYETQVFDVVPDRSISYQVTLMLSPKLLSEVVVTGRKLTEAEWKESYNDFRTHFIGDGQNSKHCTILNPKALMFDIDGDQLMASVDDALVIKNSGLGYLIYTNIQTYTYNRKAGVLGYEVLPRYEMLKPKNKKESVRWAKNRLEAYQGSQMHFMRALYHRRLNEEGFYFTMKDSPLPADTLVMARSPIFGRQPRQFRTMKDYSHIVKTDNDKSILSFNGSILVNYIDEAESDKYHRSRSMPFGKTVQFSMIKSMSPATLSPDGRVYPINSIEASGYWSWELMSEALPLDYDPADDLKIIADN